MNSLLRFFIEVAAAELLTAQRVNFGRAILTPYPVHKPGRLRLGYARNLIRESVDPLCRDGVDARST